ncbi:Crinkler (CRN) [Phytophthora megakarya]|uniref:Crinkler (CRN) n=1 Tax=Phytophthora megakarya TaxID=4795 RepID=A0A225W8W9_9STRA|nr:Crinkler (CRN) [Phytophthora megakarya]
MVKLFCAIVGEVGSTFSVRVDENDSVDELKSAIQKKKKRNVLKDVDPGELQLFLAKTEGGAWLPSNELASVQGEKGFERVPVTDAKWTIKDREKGFERVPVTDATWAIKDVLTDMKMPIPRSRQIHVLVVVPQQWTSTPIVSQDGVFHHCRDSFFSQFSTVDQVGDWLQFSALLPLTERNTLYVRSSYKSIANQALLKVDPIRRKYAVVTGTPGIGKSVFVYYVMWRLIKDKKRVLLMTEEPAIYFDGSRMWE